jgi:hypothetical protein
LAYRPQTFAEVVEQEHVCRTLANAIEKGRFSGFADFIRWSGEQAAVQSVPAMFELHREVLSFVESGDPTPFKAYRFEELRQTVARMGNLEPGAPMEERMREEVCITGEVWQVSRWLLERGALVTTFSDKPEEASLSSDGTTPSVHEAETDIVSAR